MSSKKIAIIGLGYVGLPLAVEFGKKKAVIGFDIDENKIFINKKIFAYKMPKERSINIDTYNDFKIAEVLIR